MEEWKEFHSTKRVTIYVSNFGRVRSIRNDCGVERFLKLHGQYLGFAYYIGRKQVTQAVHVAVANLFLGQRPDKMVANHRDGNKHNNHVSNLEWVTKREDSLHAYRTGLSTPYDRSGENNPCYGKDKYPEGVLKRALGMVILGVKFAHIEQFLGLKKDSLGVIVWRRRRSGVYKF